MSEDNRLPAGRYLARVSEAVMARTNSGAPQIAVGFEIVTPETQAGRQITWYGSLSDTVISRGKNEGKTVAQTTFDTMEILGWDFDEKSFASCTDAEASLKVDDDVGNDGVTRAKVTFVNPPTTLGAAVRDRLNPEQTAGALSSFKAEILKRRQKSQAKRHGGNGGSRGHDYPPPPDDSDVPF